VIVVDSSVWIDRFSGRATRQTARLVELLDDEDLPIIVGDIVMYEVLYGFRTASAALAVRGLLERRLLVSMLGFDLVYRAIGNYRTLRAKGVTIKPAEIFIGTWCLENGVELLSADRHFLAMHDHLGLRLLPDP
jgi:predicted nucleic acid-binding protein